MIALLGLLLCSSGVAHADDVAAVLLVSGEAKVITPEGTGPAVQGVGLEREDAVRTSEAGAVILQLHNNHLVRVDEDLRLEVEDIVFLDAPTTETPVADQLRDLLYPEERATVRGLEEAERVAGWHARPTAAFTPGHEESDALTRETSESGQAITRSEPERPRPLRGTDPQEIRTALLPGGELHACVAEWAAGFPVEVEEVTLVLRVFRGRIDRVLARGGLHPPACVRDPLTGTRVKTVENELTITVPVGASE